jgi:hypothetical protein
MRAAFDVHMTLGEGDLRAGPFDTLEVERARRIADA